MSHTPFPFPHWISQVSPYPEKCSHCGKFLKSGVRYHRWTFDPDGIDPRGRDVCERCRVTPSHEMQPA